ncbi:unnamed protein product, partial [Ectocarpus sp. 12 AP-2014]
MFAWWCFQKPFYPHARTHGYDHAQKRSRSTRRKRGGQTGLSTNSRLFNEIDTVSSLAMPLIPAHQQGDQKSNTCGFSTFLARNYARQRLDCKTHLVFPMVLQPGLRQAPGHSSPRRVAVV